MKLTIAAAILAETLPAAVSSSLTSNGAASASLSAFSKKDFQAALLSQRANGAPMPAGRAAGISSGLKLTDWANQQANDKRKGALRNLVAAEQGLVQECDPHSEDADVGVLSCGEGRYCLESTSVYTASEGPSSKLGGLCVTDVNGRAATMHRQLQGGVDTTAIDDMYALCYANNSTDSYITCECSDVDVALYTGTAACTTESFCSDTADVCGANVTLCYNVAYTLAFTAPNTGESKICYYFTAPTVFDYCLAEFYSGTAESTGCEIEVLGQTCSSCGLVDLPYGGIGNTTCLDVDCSNTDLGIALPLCNTSIVEGFLRQVLTYAPIAEGPCPSGCNVCGEGGFMANLDTYVTFPTGDSAVCGAIEFASFTGYFALTGQEELCDLLPALVAEPCGCSGGADSNSTSVPAPSPTAEGAEPTSPPETSDFPVAAPSDEGSTETEAPTVTSGSAPAPSDAPAPSAAVTASVGVAAAAAMVGTLLMSA
jgi:hypothetical protein